MKYLYLDTIEKQYDVCVCLTGSPHSANEYKKIIPSKYVHSKYSPKILEEFFTTCDQLIKAKKQLPRTFFILDDVLRMRKSRDGSRTMDDPQLHKFFAMHRHYNASCALIVQNIACGSSSWILNSDVFLTCPSSLHNGNDFRLVAENYMGSKGRASTDANYEILDLRKISVFGDALSHSDSETGGNVAILFRVPSRIKTDFGSVLGFDVGLR